ncbi:small acidic family domain protein [Fusarium beomiforme]|uniref:Small acidic protein n=1 Tax=Fusarium beomiforme TaxID=44412 RepID=A0A9P5AHC7_9HYPO|nr:small acidic family domain protein [Fusarium beomiforme]
MSSSTTGGVSLNPEVKSKKEKNLKRKQDKSAKLEQRKKKRSAKAEKRALKELKAAADSHPKEVVGGKPRKSKTVAKKTVNASKRKEKLKARAEKLQEKANLLLAEAKKAAAQYQALLDAEANAGSDSSSEDGGGAPVAKQPTEVPTNIPADEIVMKHRRLSNATSERSHVSAADISPEVEEEPEESKKEKKSRKGKKVRLVEPEKVEDEAVESEPEVEKPKASDKKAKKAEKKRKRAAEDKDKKEKEPEAPAQAEQWQVDDLEGGSARQAKFLRLLGGKKAGASIAASSHNTKGASDSTKAEADIQKQFEAGMKMKNDGGSKRRGLGA